MDKISVNPDFRDLLAAFVAGKVEFLVVGGYAVAAHGFVRATKDLDIWVRATPGNAQQVWESLKQFGAPMHEWSVSDFYTPDMVMFMGQPPMRVDFLTSISGMQFDDAWKNRVYVDFEGLRVPVIGVRELIDNKLASGRDQDIADAKRLRNKLPGHR